VACPSLFLQMAFGETRPGPRDPGGPGQFPVVQGHAGAGRAESGEALRFALGLHGPQG